MFDRPPSVSEVYHRWLALYVPVAALVLGVSTVVGFFLGSFVPVESLPAPGETGSNPFFPAELTTYSIAVNNLVALGIMLLGAVSLGIATVFSLALNGLLIGAVVGIAVQQASPVAVFALIAPHGVIEIPALLIVAAIGLRFGRLTVRYLRGKETVLVTERDLREAGWLLVVAIVLILIAAYVEANVTIGVAERVAGRKLLPAGS